MNVSKFISLLLFPILIFPQDLIITTEQTFEDTTIVLYGNLIVNPGGSLTLRRVTLKMFVDQGGQMIDVKPGGSMFIFDNCEISSTNPDSTFGFRVEGTEFEMHNSELRDCSGGGYAASEIMGLYIKTNNAVIDSNRFINYNAGIIINSSGATITNNALMNPQETGIYMFYAENCRIEGNYVTGLSPLVLLNSNNNEILNNTLLGDTIRLINSSNNIRPIC